MNALRKLIHTLLEPYLLVMGAVTGLSGLLLALAPGAVAPRLLVLPLAAGKEDYTPLFQHWGVLLALVGFFMVAAARNKHWQVPAMAISGVEKAVVALFGWLLYPGAFITLLGLVIDTVGAAFSLLYFVVILTAPGAGGHSSGNPTPRARG